MARSEQDVSYYEYLTERMDRGESKNIVIPTAVEQIKHYLKTKSRISVIDVGCFNGAMLNRIRILTPEEMVPLVDFRGADIDEELIADGRIIYPEIIFDQVDLKGSVGHLGQYDVVITANVLHEVISSQGEGVLMKNDIKTALHNIALLTKEDGVLILLDGLKPDNDEEEIIIEHSSSDSYDLFKLFTDRYSAFEVMAEHAGENHTKTRVKDLAAFLTKARYLGEDYWPIESTQIYQYFNREQFYRSFEQAGFNVERFEPQRFPQEHLDGMFCSITPQIEIPAKNVLIVGRKI